MPDTKTQSLDQQRATFAWQRALKAQQELKNKFDAYTNLAKSAPALVMSNGLMQTLAFFQDKSDESKQLNRDICAWLARKFNGLFKGDEYRKVMEGLHKASSAEYLQATEEALEILRWIRQFAPTLKG